MQRTMIFLVVLMLGAIALSGCGTATRTNKVKKIERMLVFGADNSGSLTVKGKKQYSGILETIVSKQKGKASVRIYRFALEVDTVYADTPKSVEEIWAAIDNQVAVNHAEKRRGTSFSAMLAKFREECGKTNLPVYGVILSDGGATDLQDTMTAAKELAKVPNFCGLFVAPVINGEIRSKLERVLSPLGDKVIIRSWEDLNGGLREFCVKMKYHVEIPGYNTGSSAETAPTAVEATVNVKVEEKPDGSIEATAKVNAKDGESNIKEKEAK